MKNLKTLFLWVIPIVILYMILNPSSCISWLANRESLYIVKHNGFEINILKNPGNATVAEYLQIELNGKIALSEKSKGDVGTIIVNDSVIKILISPTIDIGKLYIDTITFNYIETAH